MADPRPCFACAALCCGLRDLRPEGGHVELACAKHRDARLAPQRAFRCEGCTEVKAPLTLLETPRGTRWLCFDCQNNPDMKARVLGLELPAATTTATTKETPDA